MNQIERNIKARRRSVNLQIRSKRSNIPRIKRNRPRTIDERNAITKITKASVERAKREGKMKIIGKRKIYYDPTD